MLDCRQTSPTHWTLMNASVLDVWLMNLAPKAVLVVLLVANRPSARLVLLGRPKLSWPPVVWSPSVAPKRERPRLRPYHPARLVMPSPPVKPLATTPAAKSYGL